MFAWYNKARLYLDDWKIYYINKTKPTFRTYFITVEELFIKENDRNGFGFWYSITLTELFQYQVLH